MNIGNRIKYFRTQKGITVNKLANISGVSQSFLRDIELGNKQPTVEYLSYICDGLGITLSKFFEDESNDSLYSAINSLNEAQKSAIIQLIKSINEEK